MWGGNRFADSTFLVFSVFPAPDSPVIRMDWFCPEFIIPCWKGYFGCFLCSSPDKPLPRWQRCWGCNNLSSISVLRLSRYLLGPTFVPTFSHIQLHGPQSVLKIHVCHFNNLRRLQNSLTMGNLLYGLMAIQKRPE